MSTLILDSFTDTNGTDLAAHTITPTNVPTAVWSSLSGSFEILTNKAVPSTVSPSPTNFDVVDSGVGDCTITVTVNVGTQPATGYGLGLIFRATDSGNCWIARLGTPGTGAPSVPGLALYKAVSGSFSQVAYTSFTVSVGSDLTLQVVLAGSSITATLNGSNTTSATDSFNQTATKHGLYDDAYLLDTFGNFEIDINPLSAGTLTITNAFDTELDTTFAGGSGGTQPYSYAYQIIGGQYASYTTVATHTSQTSSDTYNYTGLYPGTSYTCRVLVMDAASSSAFSNTPGNNTTGPSLTGGNVSFGGITTTTINVVGSVLSGGTQPYTVYFQRSPDNATWATVSTQTDGGFGTNITDTGLTMGTLYYYRIYAVDSTSSPSPLAQLTSGVSQRTNCVEFHDSYTHVMVTAW